MLKISKRQQNLISGREYHAIRVAFPQKLRKAWGMSQGDIIGYAIKDDKLILEYLGGVRRIKRDACEARIKTGSIHVSRARLPEVSSYVLPKGSTNIPFEVKDGKLYLDLTPYKAKPSGFAVIGDQPKKPEIKKIAGFRELGKEFYKN